MPSERPIVRLSVSLLVSVDGKGVGPEEFEVLKGPEEVERLEEGGILEVIAAVKVFWMGNVDVLRDEEPVGEFAGADADAGGGEGEGTLGVVNPVLFGSAVAVELTTAVDVDSGPTIVEPSLE